MEQKVLYGCSPNAFKDKGGGEVLLLKSKQYVQEHGFKVELYNGKQSFKEYDLFHNFNVHRDCFDQIESAKNAGLKVVISPVYWPSLRHAILWNKPIAEKAKLLAVEVLNKTDVWGITAVKKMLAMADVVTPSSRAEAAILESTFKVEPEKIRIIHNGVEARFEKAQSEMFEEKYGLRDFVLYVGRIEERKNVLSLVKAMKGTGKQLVIIGNSKSGSRPYYDKCRKEAGQDVLFLPRLEHDSKMLEAAYAACKVFALPSWYETPGLAALEAGLAGANVIVTKEGCTKEYFGSFASYINPRSVSDIRKKVIFELENPRQNILRAHIKEKFLWDNTALETKQAYQKALELRT